MIQPFILFEKKYLAGLMNLRKYFLIVQTYHRADKIGDYQGKRNILVTDYSDPGLAITHLKAVKNDPHALQLSLLEQADQLRLVSMLADDSFRLFWTVIRDPAPIKKAFDLEYKGKARKYIERNTNWQIGKVEDVKAQGFEVHFGELKVRLSYMGESRLIKFEEIENQ